MEAQSKEQLARVLEEWAKASSDVEWSRRQLLVKEDKLNSLLADAVKAMGIGGTELASLAGGEEATDWVMFAGELVPVRTASVNGETARIMDLTDMERRDPEKFGAEAVGRYLESGMRPVPVPIPVSASPLTANRLAAVGVAQSGKALSINAIARQVGKDLGIPMPVSDKSATASSHGKQAKFTPADRAAIDALYFHRDTIQEVARRYKADEAAASRWLAGIEMKQRAAVEKIRKELGCH